MPEGWLTGSAAPAAAYDVLLLDLDGVVYVGDAAVDHAVEALAAVAERGLRVAFVTNNASRTPAEVAEHLRRIGVAARDDDVVTSAQAGARILADAVPAGSPVLAIGGPGVAAALVQRGLVPVTSEADLPVAVLQGFGADVGWRLLAQGGYALARGVPWVATNTDRTLPTPTGPAPGNGALVRLLAEHTGRDPVVAGKPEPPLMRESLERTGGRRALVVGDRLDTDIAGAVRCGVDSMLVMTGVTDGAELLAAPPGQRPTFLAADLRGLLEAQPAVERDADGWWHCGPWTARSGGGRLLLDVDGPGLDPAGSAGAEQDCDALRACAAAAWEAADTSGVVPDATAALGIAGWTATNSRAGTG